MTSTTSTSDYDLQIYRERTKTWNDKPLGYLDRYYKRFIHKKQLYMFLRQAPNGLVVVGVRYLPSFSDNTSTPSAATVTASDLSIELAFDLVGEKVTPGTMIARINDKPIFANVHGKLLEVNERLIDEPGLVLTDPTVQGFFAIIMPKNADKNMHEYYAVDQL
ncbi:unnamed protein product [Absidia cylindrospora]